MAICFGILLLLSLLLRPILSLGKGLQFSLGDALFLALFSCQLRSLVKEGYCDPLLVTITLWQLGIFPVRADLSQGLSSGGVFISSWDLDPYSHPVFCTF